MSVRNIDIAGLDSIPWGLGSPAPSCYWTNMARVSKHVQDMASAAFADPAMSSSPMPMILRVPIPPVPPQKPTPPVLFENLDITQMIAILIELQDNEPFEYPEHADKQEEIDQRLQDYVKNKFPEEWASYELARKKYDADLNGVYSEYYDEFPEGPYQKALREYEDQLFRYKRERTHWQEQWRSMESHMTISNAETPFSVQACFNAL